MRRGERRAAGFSYVWVLGALATLSIGMAALGPAWSEYSKRQREQELLRVGAIYANAISSYYADSPGSLRTYPPSLESLLVDSRYIATRRHIRKLYADPLNPARPWGILTAPDGGVRGVYSQSNEVPFARTEIDLGVAVLPAARSYSEWKFTPKQSDHRNTASSRSEG